MSPPIDSVNFDFSVPNDVAYTSDTTTSAVSASTFVSTCPGASKTLLVSSTSYGFDFSTTCSSGAFKLYMLTSVADTADEALELLSSHASDPPSSFAAACEDAATLFSRAFDPANSVFSGNLPSMTSNDPALDALFVWSATAQLSLMRTSMASFPRQYVISEGASNSLDGSAGMGGAGQFVWDLSFSAVTLALLDPDAAMAIATHVVANSEFGSHPIGVPQAWDAFPSYPNVVGGGQYAFDFLASFIYIKSLVTNSRTGFAFLTTPIKNNHDGLDYTPLDFLKRIATHMEDYPRSVASPYLVDYGSDKRSFLEAAPTYTNVIAGLQAGNAGMMLSLASLLETMDVEAPLVDSLRTNATHIVDAIVKFQYIEGGYFACLNATEGYDPVEVMALADHVYVGMSLGVLGEQSDLLPDSVRDSMSEFFFTDYLSGNGWIRALSLRDGSMSELNCDPQLCSDTAKVSMR